MPPGSVELTLQGPEDQHKECSWQCCDSFLSANHSASLEPQALPRCMAHHCSLRNQSRNAQTLSDTLSLGAVCPMLLSASTPD